MKAAAFDYFAPRTVDDALDLLARSGGSAKVLAGGQTLVPVMAFRLAQPPALVDLNRIPGLNYIREDGDTVLIGAMTRHRDVERSEIVSRHLPLLSQAIREVAHPVIRNRGTAGGSLSHADPAAEWPTVAVALKASFVLRSAQGTRTVAARDFFLSLLTTALSSEELLVEIRIPKRRENARAVFLEVNRRHGDFAIVSVAAQMEVNRAGEVQDVALVLGGVAAVPFDAGGIAESMRGRRLADLRFEDIGQAVAGKLSPGSDIHASADYRRDLAGGLVVRALTQLREKF